MCQTKGAKDYQVRDADTLDGAPGDDPLDRGVLTRTGGRRGSDSHHRRGTAVGRTPRPGARRGRAGRHLDTDDEAGRSQVSGGRAGTLSVSADVLRQQPLSSIRFQPASGCWACSNTIRVRSTRERMPSLLNMRRR
jgi:hypothetical protein